MTKFSHARNRPRIRSNVGVSLTANIVGAILKQAGLSESVFFQNERKFVMKTYVEWVSIDDESD